MSSSCSHLVMANDVPSGMDRIYPLDRFMCEMTLTQKCVRESETFLLVLVLELEVGGEGGTGAFITRIHRLW